MIILYKSSLLFSVTLAGSSSNTIAYSRKSSIVFHVLFQPFSDCELPDGFLKLQPSLIHQVEADFPHQEHLFEPASRCFSSHFGWTFMN